MICFINDVNEQCSLGIPTAKETLSTAMNISHIIRLANQSSFALLSSANKKVVLIFFSSANKSEEEAEERTEGGILCSYP